MIQTYYEILGVTKDSTDAEIKSSYHRLAIKYHPDKNPNDPSAADKFQEISKAYGVLSDSEKRVAYNEELSAPKQTPKHTVAASSDRQYGKTGFDLADSLRIFMDTLRNDRTFQRSFYRTSDSSGINQGSNVQIHARLSLLEIMDGVRKKIGFAHKKKCTACDGTGDREKQTNYASCKACNGHGKVRVADSEEIRICTICNGFGTTSLNPCPACAGSGIVKGNTEIIIKFEAGVSEGNYISISGMGNAGPRGAQAGNLIVVIQEEKHKTFIRKGYDLETEIIISLSTAVFGGSASVTDLKEQSHDVQIGPGTNPGTVIRLEQKGLPFYKKNGKGDLFVRVNVEIPKNLSHEAQDAFRIFAELIEKSATDNNYSYIGRYCVIGLCQENDQNKLQIALNTANHLLAIQKPIAFDSTQVPTMSSGLISKIVKIHRKMELYNEKLVLAGCQHAVYSVFQDCNLDEVFIFVETVEDLKELDKPEIMEGADGSGVPLVRDKNGHKLVYAGAGNFNFSVFAENDVHALFEKKGSSIGMDLRDVTSINSMVMGGLIKEIKYAKKMACQFFLYKPQKKVVDVLKLASLDKLFVIVEREKELDSLKISDH
jgi:molecular chaperone DnaJ